MSCRDGSRLGGISERIGQRNGVQLRLHRIERSCAGRHDLDGFSGQDVEVVVGYVDIEIAEGKINAARKDR